MYPRVDMRRREIFFCSYRKSRSKSSVLQPVPQSAELSIMLFYVDGKWKEIELKDGGKQ
jgi:hypothetical protein